MDPGEPTTQELRDIYTSTATIAVVGASTDPSKAAHRIPRYLNEHGYRIIPVSPRSGELFGETVRPALSDVTDAIDVVDVFRPPQEAVSIARDAVASGARVLWFQPGTDTDDAVVLAAEAGMTVVRGRCMKATHSQLGLGRRA